MLISKLPMFLRHISPLTLVHWVPACQLWYVRLCICRHRLVCGVIGASTYPVAIRTYVPYSRCESHPTEDSSPGVQMWVGVLCCERGWILALPWVLGQGRPIFTSKLAAQTNNRKSDPPLVAAEFLKESDLKSMQIEKNAPDTDTVPGLRGPLGQIRAP